MLCKFLISDQSAFPWKPEPVQIPYEDDSQNKALPFHYDTMAKFTVPIHVCIIYIVYYILHNIYYILYMIYDIHYILHIIYI